jgi:hypothetical protein
MRQDRGGGQRAPLSFRGTHMKHIFTILYGLILMTGFFIGISKAYFEGHARRKPKGDGYAHRL